MPHITIPNSYATRQGADTVQFIKTLRLRRYGHVDRMQNHRMTKQIARTKMVSTKKGEDHVQNSNTR